MYLSWRIWIVYLVLLLAGVPWYWQLMPRTQAMYWLGIPLWVTISLATGLLASAYTAWLYSMPWLDDEPEAD